MRILIVDDNSQESDVLKKLLKRRFDAEVFQAASMKEADLLIKANNLDCIILDLALPDCGIDKTIAHIRNMPYPVYVYTGFDDPTIRERVLSAGAEDFILKATGNAGITERIAHKQFKRNPDIKLLEGAYQARHDEPARMVRSELRGTIPRLAAAIMSVVMFIGGLFTGTWALGRVFGQSTNAQAEHFAKLDTAILEMKSAGASRDAILAQLADRVTRGESERQALKDESKLRYENILDSLKRIDTQLTNIYLFHPEQPMPMPKTTRR